MNIYANHGRRGTTQDLGERLLFALSSLDEFANGVEQKRSASASRVQYTLTEWVRDRSVDDQFREPIRRVVLA